MRRLFGWLAGLVGIAALARLLARRERRPPLPTTTSVGPDPAAELRRKLSESRAEPPAGPEPGAPEPGSPAADEERESLEDRRARVHAKAMQAIDEMKEPEA